MTVPGTSLTTAITGLSTGNMYQITVSVQSAVNVKDCQLSNSVTVNGITKQTLPQPPTIASVVAINSTNVQVNWAPPSCQNQNGIITAYTIEYSRVPGQAKANGSLSNAAVAVPVSTVTLGGKLSYSISGLEPAISYKFRMLATNGNGSSVFSSSITGSPLESGLNVYL